MTDEAQRHDFLARAEELCDALYADVQELRRAAALPPRERRALLDRAFRDAHTLKGTASALPLLAPASRLAHELENLLAALRAATRAPDEAALDACEDAADTLSRTVESAARDTPSPDASEVVARLRSLAAAPVQGRDGQRDEARRTPGDSAGGPRAEDDETRASPDQSRASVAQSRGGAHAPLAPLPADIGALLNAEERRRIARVRAEGARLLLCEVAFDLSDFDEQFRRLTDALAASAEIVSTLPAAPGTTAPARIGFRLLCAAEDPRPLSPLAAGFGARLTELSTLDGDTADGASGTGETERSSDARRLNNDADDADDANNANDAAAGDSPYDGGPTDRSRAGGAESSASYDAGSSASYDGASHASSSFVRVQLSELDDLIFAANELFDDAARALDESRGETADGVRRDLVALVERVMALRMQPIGRTLERAARAARVAARRAGRRVEFEFAGGDARVDRAVAERLAAPLEHLMRNAVTHGIEPPTERRKAGKDSRGRVRVEAAAEGSRVRVTVADDGRGVDAGRVEEAARAQGLVGAGARLTEEQALRLVFRPGFSTAREVSQSAGRGVGLDAVEQEIESAGGEVRVRTRRGRGTTFELRLPLALALVPAVLARAGRHAYAIDAGRVVETLAPDARAADDEEARLTIRWRGSRVPLVTLSELTGQGAAAGDDNARPRDDAPNVLVVRADDARARDLFDDGEAGGEERKGERESSSFVAVAVDQLMGRREVLVRTLGRHAKRWRGVAGAVDLRDGTVALMLDLPRLLER